MSNYRRFYLPGHDYFFTLVTYQRKPIFSDENKICLLFDAIKKVQKNYPFKMYAWVILPDHLHCLLNIEDKQNDFSIRWRLIKREFSLQIDMPVNSRGEKLIWQKRFWEHCIRNEKDWKNHMDYIHYNPIKHGYAKSAHDWRYSSFKNWIDIGFYNKNWGNVISKDICDMDFE